MGQGWFLFCHIGLWLLMYTPLSEGIDSLKTGKLSY